MGSGSSTGGLASDHRRPRPRQNNNNKTQPQKQARSSPPHLHEEGSKAYVFKQDPSVDVVGFRQVWVLEQIVPGPSTKNLTIEGMPGEYGPSDAENNYLYKPSENEDAFDAVHTLVVVERVRWMVQRALHKLDPNRKLKWHFDAPIKVYPVAEEMKNAYYSRFEEALKFGFFEGINENETIKACRSWDVVSHEVGHAILDFLQPEWIYSFFPQSGALHESFGDIMAIASILDNMDMCETIVANTRGNLHDRNNMLAIIGEQFGMNVGKPCGIRNAAADLTLSQVSNQVHDLSQVFTGAVYDVLVRIFEESLDPGKHQPSETLYFTSSHVFALVLGAFIDGPKYGPLFRDIAKLMMKKEPEERFKKVIWEEFVRREVFDENVKPREVGSAPESGSICTTMAMFSEMKK